MRLREIERTDIKDILDIRVSTIENHFSMTDLAEVGVTQESIAEWLEGSVKGWVCENSGESAGFALADSKTAEVLVVACYPKYERRGIGKTLMLKVHEWLWSFDHDEIWLWSDSDPGIRAYGFYRKLGYEPAGVTKGSDELLILKRRES